MGGKGWRPRTGSCVGQGGEELCSLPPCELSELCCPVCAQHRTQSSAGAQTLGKQRSSTRRMLSRGTCERSWRKDREGGERETDAVTQTEGDGDRE